MFTYSFLEESSTVFVALLEIVFNSSAGIKSIQIQIISKSDIWPFYILGDT